MTKTPQTARKRPATKQSATPSEIRFYRSNEKPYGAFSNLYPRPIEFEGRIFPTSEHAYQAGKAQKPAVREWILSAPTPALAAMAAELKNPARPRSVIVAHWDAMQGVEWEDVMALATSP